jgi:hypothetical protein
MAARALTSTQPSVKRAATPATSLAAVVHRKDHYDMLVTMRFDEFCTLLRRSDFPVQPKTQPQTK